MLRRTPFRKPGPPPRPARIWEGPMPTPRPIVAARPDSGLRLVAPVPKENAIECEPYRRLVAALPCVRCQIEGFSQAAHPNTDKAKGAKADDRECFPMCCDRPGVVGCHFLFDQHKLGPRPWAADFERLWGDWTRAQIVAAGKWPKRLPRWEA